MSPAERERLTETFRRQLRVLRDLEGVELSEAQIDERARNMAFAIELSGYRRCA